MIYIHELSDFQGLNPYTTSDASASSMFKKIFDGLLEQDYETSELYPSVAEALPKVSDDHLSYTFTIKKNVKFSDGHALTSKDVLFSFKALKNPLIIDAAPNRTYVDDVADVLTPDDYTVEIKMKKPYFMAMFQLGDVRLLPKHVLDPNNLTDKYSIAETNDTTAVASNVAMKQFADWFSKAEIKRDSKYLVGSGPYMMDEWKTGEYVRFKKNPNYWNTTDRWREQQPEMIVGKIINDRQAAITALKSKELDFMEYVPPPMYDEQIDVAKVDHLQKELSDQSVYTYIGWNTARPIFSDKKVRQALSHMVDRDMLMKTIVRGYATKQNSPVYQSRPDYDKTLTGYEFNAEKAKQLLTEAGWGDSDGDGILDKNINGENKKFEFSITINAGNEARENISILVSNELKKHGIICRVQKLEWSVFLENTRSHNFDAYIGSWVNDAIPTDLFQLWHSSAAKNSGSNYVSFINKRADELMEGMRLEFDDAKRNAMSVELQRIIYDESPYTFLYSPKYPSVYNKRLKNVKFYPVRPGYNICNWMIEQ